MLLQEVHLPWKRLERACRLVHRLLPGYSLYAGRPRKEADREEQTQVVTLVHVYISARATILDIGQELAAAAHEAPEAKLHAQFIRLAEPRTEATLLIGNIYQAQAIRPAQQAAILELAGKVVRRWSADLVIVGGISMRALGPAPVMSALMRLEKQMPVCWSGAARQGLSVQHRRRPPGCRTTSRMQRY